MDSTGSVDSAPFFFLFSCAISEDSELLAPNEPLRYPSLSSAIRHKASMHTSCWGRLADYKRTSLQHMG